MESIKRHFFNAWINNFSEVSTQYQYHILAVTYQKYITNTIYLITFRDTKLNNEGTGQSDRVLRNMVDTL